METESELEKEIVCGSDSDFRVHELRVGVETCWNKSSKLCKLPIGYTIIFVIVLSKCHSHEAQAS